MAGEGRQKFWLPAFLAIILMATSGCFQRQGSSTPAAASTMSQAPVESVEVYQLLGSSGAQETYRALVKGTLPDSCTRLGEPVVSSGGTIIAVILPAYRDAGAQGCAASIAYERVIALGNGLRSGQYRISVNGISAAFTVAASTGQASALPAATVVAAANTGTGETASAGPAAAPPEKQQITGPAADQQAVQQQGTGPAAQRPEIQQQGTGPAAQLPETQQQGTGPAAQQPKNQLQGTGQAADQPASQQQSTEPAAQQTTAQQPANSVEPCINKAAFVLDVTIPDGTLFDPGEVFTKTWRIRNVGTCAWDGYTLAFQEGDLLGMQPPLKLPGPTRPGEMVDIALKMTAPQKPGGYYSDWLISTPDGNVFGLGNPSIGLLWTKIGVRTLVTAESSEPVCAFQTDPAMEAEMARYINALRAERGLPALTVNPKLSDAARLHSQDMACHSYPQHTSYKDGSLWFARIQAQGIRYHWAGENIAAGDPAFHGDAKWAVTVRWMADQEHRDNLFNPIVTQVGVGYVYFENSDDKGYYTADFIKP